MKRKSKAECKQLIQQIFNLLNQQGDLTYIEPSKDVLQYLPLQHKDMYLVTYTKQSTDGETDKFIVYFLTNGFEVQKGPGMYSSTSSWGVLAREVKLCFCISL